MGTDTLSVIVTPVDDPDATKYGYASDNNRSAAVYNGVIQKAWNAIHYARQRIDDLLGSPKLVSGVDTATDIITTAATHGISAGDVVRFKALGAGALPGGVDAATPYYWLADTASTGKVSLTSGGAAVDLTTSGTGPFYVYKVPDVLGGLFTNSGAGLQGLLTNLMVTTGGSQAITGAKTFSDAKMSGTAKWGLASRSLTRTIDTMWVNNTSGINGLTPHCANLIGGSGDTWYSGLDLPHGQVITEISVRLDPVNVGALPGTMPSIAISKFHRTTGAITTFGTASDTSSDSATYSALHSMTISGLSETIDRSTYHYYLGVAGSSGATPANDVNMIGATATITCTSMGQWA